MVMLVVVSMTYSLSEVPRRAAPASG